MESRKPAIKDYYAILGVPPDASPAEIKKAYRTLAQRYHPDRVSAEESESAVERMVEINEAFAVVSDKKQRAAYDRERTAPSRTEPTAATISEWQRTRAPTPPPRSAEVDRSVSEDFLQKLKSAIAQQGISAKLKEQSEKPWLWSFAGKTWGGNYWVSLRLCPALNPNVARENIAQAEAVIRKRRSGWRKNSYLFILAFQSLSEGEMVLKLLRTYCNREENSSRRNLINMIVLDLNRRRSILCGKRTRDENLDRILSSLSVS